MSNNIKEANDINSQKLISMIKRAQAIYLTNETMPNFYRSACISGLNVCIDIINQYEDLLSVEEDS